MTILAKPLFAKRGSDFNDLPDAENGQQNNENTVKIIQIADRDKMKFNFIFI